MIETILFIYLIIGYVLKEIIIDETKNNISKTLFVLFYPIFFILILFKIKPINKQELDNFNKKLNEEK